MYVTTIHNNNHSKRILYVQHYFAGKKKTMPRPIIPTIEASIKRRITRLSFTIFRHNPSSSLRSGFFVRKWSLFFQAFSWLVNAPPFPPFPPFFQNISSCSSFYYNSPPIPPFPF